MIDIISSTRSCDAEGDSMPGMYEGSQVSGGSSDSRTARCSRSSTTSAGRDPAHPGVGTRQHEGPRDRRVASVQLDGEPAAEGQTEHMRPVQPERSDEAGHGVGVVGQAEGLGWVRGLPVARRVPRHDGELVGEGVELGAPCSAIAAIAPMEKEERRTHALALEGDAESRNRDLVHLHLPAGLSSTVQQATQIVTKRTTRA